MFVMRANRRVLAFDKKKPCAAVVAMAVKILNIRIGQKILSKDKAHKLQRLQFGNQRNVIAKPFDKCSPAVGDVQITRLRKIVRVHNNVIFHIQPAF